MQDEFLELDPVVPEQKKQKKVKADTILQADLAVVILFLLFFIVFPFFTDANSAGFFLPPFLVVLSGFLLYPFALSKPVMIRVMRRVNRDQTDGLKQMLSKLSFGCVLSGLFLFVLLLAFAAFFSYMMFGVKSVLTGCVLGALTFFICSLQAVPLGTLAGAGYGNKVIASHVIRSVFSILLAVPLSIYGAGYGVKTDALLHTQTGVYAYASLGALGGFFAGAFVSGLYLLIAQLRCLRRLEEKNEDAIRAELPDAPSEYLRFPYGISVTTPVFLIFLGMLLFVLLEPLSAGTLYMERLNGIFGRGIFFQMMIALVLCLFFVRGAYRMSAMIIKNDVASARNLYRHLRFFIQFYTLPFAAISLVLAGTFCRLFDRYPSKETVISACISSVFVLTLPMIVFGTLTFLRIRKYILILFNAAVVPAVYALSFFVLTKGLHLRVYGAVGAGAISFAVWALLLYLTTAVMLKVRMRFMRDTGKFMIAAVIAGGMTYLMNAILLSVIGEVLTIILSGVIGFLFYFIVLIILRAISVPDLYHLPFGDRIVPVLRAMHLVD